MPNDRPKVGPADPDTIHRMLQQTLAEPTGSTGVATPPPAPKKKRTGLTVAEGLNPKVKRDTAHSGETVDEIVKRAIDGAPKP